MQSWSTIRDAVAPLMAKYGHVEDAADGVRYPLWALVREELWIVEREQELSLTSRGRRPTLLASTPQDHGPGAAQAA
jgi:5-methylcytosine-specific restriction protein A